MAGTRTTARSIGTTGIDVGAPRARSDARHPAPRPAGVAFALRGFTGIELMIAVAIIAILASIALPSYSSAMAKLNRTAAEQFMISIAQKEEQVTLYQNSFVATIGTGGLGLAPTPDVAANYTFAVALTGQDCLGGSLSGAAYVITATAIGAQAADGNLCLDSANHHAPSGKWGS